MTTTEPTTNGTLSVERSDLLDALHQHRSLLRDTTRDLTDEQAARTPTASELCLGGLLKHVAHGEQQWVNFILDGPGAMLPDGRQWADWTEQDYAAYGDTFRMHPGETLAGVLAEYQRVARRTDEVVATTDLDASHPLPKAPWFAPGVRWSARRVLMHLIAEIAQHAGHADIIRETIDGAKSMG